MTAKPTIQPLSGGGSREVIWPYNVTKLEETIENINKFTHLSFLPRRSPGWWVLLCPQPLLTHQLHFLACLRLTLQPRKSPLFMMAGPNNSLPNDVTTTRGNLQYHTHDVWCLSFHLIIQVELKTSASPPSSQSQTPYPLTGFIPYSFLCLLPLSFTPSPPLLSPC